MRVTTVLVAVLAAWSAAPAEGSRHVAAHAPSLRSSAIVKQQHRNLQAVNPETWASAGSTYEPVAGKGSWEAGGSTGCILVHANLMKGGDVVGWSSRNQGPDGQDFGSVAYNAQSKTYETLLDECGVHGRGDDKCRNAFCGAQTTTALSEVLLFGGHADDIQWFRHYSHGTRDLEVKKMSSGRWYPGVVTLPDGRVMVVGGVNDSGKAGYHVADEPEYDNPSYEIYNPKTRSFSGDQWGMRDQLSAAFPIHTYPVLVVLPDGGLAMNAGSLLAKYKQVDEVTWEKAHDYPSRPGPPWQYPQTGVGLPLPMVPPYDRLCLLAAGGSEDDEAGYGDPASDRAQVIELTAGPQAQWQDVGPMPHRRIMADAVILCDGTIGFFNGAEKGLAGWYDKPQEVQRRDGSSWHCEEKCSKAENPVYEPSIFNPGTGQWTAKGSLAEMGRQRLYHSVAILLPDCRVLTAGSDVTWDKEAEIYSPPYFSRGPQPVITEAPSFVQAGQNMTVKYASADPVTRAILIRTGAVTHSTPFDARALWLDFSSPANGTLSVATPARRAVLPPGMYQLSLLSDKGVPSTSAEISFP